LSPGNQDRIYAQAQAEHGEAMRRLVRGYERDADRQRDLLQEMHIELWRSLKGFDQRCSLRTWVYRVAHNIGTDHLATRRKASERWVELDALPVDPTARAGAIGKLWCDGFLLRPYEVKRNGYLAARRLVLWIIPGIVASWLGHGESLRARTLGLDPSSAWYRYLTSGWPTVATWTLLIVVWLAFSAAAKKVSSELEALRRRVASA